MAKQEGDIELKEMCDKKQFLHYLQQFAHAIEHHKDMDIRVRGQNFSIPADAVDKGRMRVEYEIDGGEHEFELTLKWR